MNESFVINHRTAFFFETCSMSLNMKDLRLNVHKNDLHFSSKKQKYFATLVQDLHPPLTTHGKDPFLPARIC